MVIFRILGYLVLKTIQNELKYEGVEVSDEACA